MMLQSGCSSTERNVRPKMLYCTAQRSTCTAAQQVSNIRQAFVPPGVKRRCIKNFNSSQGGPNRAGRAPEDAVLRHT
jgi:hypothetical protein